VYGALNRREQSERRVEALRAQAYGASAGPFGV